MQKLRNEEDESPDRLFFNQIYKKKIGEDKFQECKKSVRIHDYGRVFHQNKFAWIQSFPNTATISFLAVRGDRPFSLPLVGMKRANALLATGNHFGWFRMKNFPVAAAASILVALTRSYVGT